MVPEGMNYAEVSVDSKYKEQYSIHFDFYVIPSKDDNQWNLQFAFLPIIAYFIWRIVLSKTILRYKAK